MQEALKADHLWGIPSLFNGYQATFVDQLQLSRIFDIY